MKVVIVEDEARIARRIARMTQAFFGEQLECLTTCDSVTQGLHALQTTTPDLLLLDLNLNGQDGFDLLQRVSTGAFHTIIISAYTEKAITAFAYGVLDFVPKPFTEERLVQAFARLHPAAQKADSGLKFLAVKKQGTISLTNIQDLRYIKGAGIYSELHLQNGRTELHDKSLERLQQLLPASFERIHKSYLVPIDQAARILVQKGCKYQLQLKNGELIPIGRSRFKGLKEKLL
ncbi:two-component system response regulator LytT [Hymenobacter sp. UYAg731]